MNNIFFTEFPSFEAKHKITEKVPFISIRAYDDLFPINIIDVPHDCPERVQQQIIACSNLVLIQSWKSEECTEEFKRQIESKTGKIITLLRDAEDLENKELKFLNSIDLEKQENIRIPNL